jgi:hypothetical protein
MNDIFKYLFRQTTNNVKNNIEIVNKLVKSKDFYKSLMYLLFIKKGLNFNSPNIDFRIFDILIVLHQYDDAINILHSISLNNNDDYFKYQKRLDIINSLMSQNYRLKINLKSNNFTLDKSLIGTHFYKGIQLCNFKIIFSSALDLDYVYIENHSKITPFEQIIPVEKIKNDATNVYTINLNLHCVETIYYCVNTNDKDLKKSIISINLVKSINIIKGKDDWLFLGNDGNKSELQFKGKELISNNELKLWKKYVNDFSKIQIPHILLIPPSKEQVFSQYYPYERASICPIDQLFKIFDDKSFVYYPLNELKSDMNSYSKTESHWSHNAARHIFYNILDSFKIKHNSFISNISTSLVSNIGDLGSKCSPVSYSNYNMITPNYDISKFLVFTNHLPTQGSIRKFFNPNSYSDKTIIIFGDSFMSVALPFYIEFFKIVIMVRSNATIISSILDHEKPDFIISEITERFIIRSPLFLNTIFDYPPFIRNDILPFVKSNIVSTEDTSDIFYDKYMNDYKKLLQN